MTSAFTVQWENHLEMAAYIILNWGHSRIWKMTRCYFGVFMGGEIRYIIHNHWAHPDFTNYYWCMKKKKWLSFLAPNYAFELEHLTTSLECCSQQCSHDAIAPGALTTELYSLNKHQHTNTKVPSNCNTRITFNNQNMN